MSDNNDSPSYVTKEDLASLLQVSLAGLEQKFSSLIETQSQKYEKDWEIKANKIVSSYANKVKKTDASAEVVDNDDDSKPRKPTKHELELQANLEKLIKNQEEVAVRAKAAERYKSVSEAIIAGGLSPDSVDTLNTIWNAKNAFIEGDDGVLRLKVDVEGGANVALPLPDAIKHFSASKQGQFFVLPKGAKGAGTTPPDVNAGKVVDKKSDVKASSPRDRLRVEIPAQAWSEMAPEIARRSLSGSEDE